MNFKAYGNRLTTKSRMARKHMRREVFLANKKMGKVIRKANRLKRKSLEEESNAE